MARKKKTGNKRAIETYEHKDRERPNNPPVGLVRPENDLDIGQQKKGYTYDPHLDPQLRWAGKDEHTSFEVPTVSLHVHERIDPRSIIEAVRRRNGNGQPTQPGLFEKERKEGLHQAIEFYKHKHNWSNRLIAGDSLLVMNSLLEKEGLAGEVQMIYIDPPYGIKYGSNFQPFVNKRDVKDGKDEDLTSEPEQIRAFRDTWELGIHSYLTYLRDRLLLARELLAESGSCFVQIGDENVHRVRCLMDEVFGAGNQMCIIPFIKTSGKGAKYLDVTNDYLLWYAKKVDKVRYSQLYQLRSKKTMDTAYNWIELPTGEFRKLTRTELDGEAPIPEGMRFVSGAMISQSGGESSRFPVEVSGETYLPSSGTFWKTNLEGMENLKRAQRLVVVGKTLTYKRYAEDFPVVAITNWWGDTKESTYAADKVFVVQTYTKVIERCLLMTTDPGDLVFDPTCVRKGTRVWCVEDGGGGPPVVPPHAEVRSLPVYGEGRGGATLRPIESIQPGDWVLGHDGQPHRVVRVIRRPYRGKMIGIRHEKTDATLWLSADHKVLAKRRPRSLGGHNDWLGIPPVLRGRSKTLRREMTPSERKLWTVLRNGQTGFTFRRQHPIGRYIADFYSRDAQLVVEVDGAAAHSSQETLAHDQARDAYLRGLGLEVLSNLEGVYETIRRTCHLQLSVEKAEWVEAQDLAVGDWVFFGPQRVAVRIAEIHTQETEEELYDLEVEDAHSFITELCVVHNCGSGTAAYVAEHWGRRWITCDTSRVAITIARQRLMTAVFDYYELAHPEEGVGSGFKYKTVPHVTLKSIANNPDIDGIYARLHPAVEAALAELNAALKLPSPDGRGAGGESYPRFKVTTGGRSGHFVDFAAPDAETFTMPAGQVVKVNELVEWEVPFEFPADWPEAARAPFDRFHQARRALQTAIDAAIARHAPQETLYDQPFVDKKKVRVTGPFTVEAVPAPAVKSVDELLADVGATGQSPLQADTSIARSGETLRQAEWRNELLRAGIRGKNGQYIRFARLEPLPGCRWLHAEGETRPSHEGADSVRETGPAYDPMRVVVSFGPEHAPLEQRQVERAWEEARMLVPKPALLLFAAFQFDPEAAKDIDEMKPELAGMQFLKVQMNADLLTDDLKKKRASNESFWLIGQPDVEVQRITSGSDKDKLRVVVHGFDYYNTKTGNVESGGADKIAVWLLDTDYDGRSLYPRQVFFPMAGEREGWAKLAKSLKAEIDEERIEAYRGTVSLPFAPGEHKRIAVKIVDDRGIESLKVIEV
ncbi:DUF559 domain-containing protein [Chloracidobacterium aggregatum]|uniref:DUF559 domain-containing protein n=1 Tax=Chloracidobacterium aggregatum TaxID=2851959 RepID=UPI0020183552|nr:DUF559 domain-containing protein [Chloracidobacterium aggregatum]